MQSARETYRCSKINSCGATDPGTERELVEDVADGDVVVDETLVDVTERTDDVVTTASATADDEVVDEANSCAPIDDVAAAATAAAAAAAQFTKYPSRK